MSAGSLPEKGVFMFASGLLVPAMVPRVFIGHRLGEPCPSVAGQSIQSRKERLVEPGRERLPARLPALQRTADGSPVIWHAPDRIPDGKVRGRDRIPCRLVVGPAGLDGRPETRGVLRGQGGRQPLDRALGLGRGRECRRVDQVRADQRRPSPWPREKERTRAR